MNKETTGRKEKHNFPLNQVYFYLTKGCNLRCRHCWVEPGYQNESRSYPTLDSALFQSIVKQAKPLGIFGVKLTGGEPLLHPQIYEILEYIRAENLTLNVETNGTLCTLELSRKMAACKNSFVSVSLDGAKAETHEWVRGVKGSFGAAKKGIQNLVKAGFQPQIIMTLMRRNKEEIEPLIRLAESLGAGSIKLNILQPIARGEKMHGAGEVLSIEELVELGRWIENTFLGKTRLSVYYSHPPAFTSLSKIFGTNGDGCSVCGILGILGVLADGSYALCGIGETVPGLIFGNAARDPLEDTWNKASVLLELREGVPSRFEGICGDCLMRNRCLGSCIAQNYYLNKNLWAPFWYCEEARKRGLFPGSRRFTKKEVHLL